MVDKAFILLINIIFLFLFTSCSEEYITGSQTGTADDSDNLKTLPDSALAAGDSLIESGVTSSGNAYRLISRWVLDHYEAEQGIILGTWPREERFRIDRLQELHYKWGFNYLHFAEVYEFDRFQLAVKAGFPANRILIAISHNSFERNIPLFGSDVFGYYFDEPADRNYPLDSLNVFRKKYAPLKPFFISGYKRNSLLKSYVEMADGVAFSSYAHWYPLLGYWVSWPENPDQRQDWTDMQQRYGSKFSFTWIGAHMDLQEYDLLLAHARKLGLKSVWLYQYQDETDDLNDTNVSMFSLYAWKHRFLVRHERREILKIEKAHSDDNLQNGSSSKENWTVTETIPTLKQRVVDAEDRPELFRK